MNERWRPGPVVAWTESDGPGRVPPVPSRRTNAACALALGVAITGILSSSSVCPEHALWIDGLASLTIVVGITAVIATARSSATGPLLALGAAVGGITVASVGLAHEVTRSRVVLIAFGLAALTSAYSALAAMKMRRWEAQVLDEAVAPIEVPALPAVPERAVAPAPEPSVAPASAESPEEHSNLST
jgi:hypothetical protein